MIIPIFPHDVDINFIDFFMLSGLCIVVGVLIKIATTLRKGGIKK